VPPSPSLEISTPLSLTADVDQTISSNTPSGKADDKGVGYSDGKQRGRRDHDKKRNMKIGRPVGASKELIRSLFRNVDGEFGVRGATMWV